MIDNTCHRVDGPMYATREEALCAPGALYIHLKKGGIYRRIVIAKWAGERAADMEGEPISVYEHLWPHDHDFYTRPDAEFGQIVTTHLGQHERFVFAVNAVVTGLDAA